MDKESFEEWMANPTTVAVFKVLRKTRDALQENIANGLTLGSTADETHGGTARAVGNIEGLNQILNISYEDEE